MNYRIAARIMGNIMGFEMVCMLIPLALAVINGDWHSARAFAYAIAVTAIFCLPALFIKPRYSQLYIKDFLLIVGGAWLLIAFFGSLPYYFSGLIGSFTNCLFESVSGFTTTGATIVSDIEVLPAAVLFWRSFTHWIAGIGVLMLVSAIYFLSDLHSYSLIRFYTKSLNHVKTAHNYFCLARILLSIYFGITLVQIIVYMLCGMPFFDSLLHAFSTAATGGFSIKNASVSAYNSLPLEMATVFFMIICSINFNLLYLMLLRRFAEVFNNQELKMFFAVIVFATILITYDLCSFFGVGFFNGLRMAFFQVATIISTTGFYTEAFEYWPQFSKSVLFILMFIGGCAGSVSGGVKVVRPVLGCISAGNAINSMLRPNTYKSRENEGFKGLTVFFCIYISVFALSFFGLSWFNYDFETTISATVSAISNIGPGLGTVSGMGNYAFWPSAAKVILMVDMLLGRLEFLPVMLLFLPKSFATKTTKDLQSFDTLRTEKQ